MARGGLFNHLKEIIGDLVDSNNNIRVTPTGSTGKRNLSNNRLKIISDIVKLLRDTSIITKETKLYITNRYISIRGVNEIMNSTIEKEDNKIKGTTTQSKIQYDKNKLEKLFGVNLFSDILSNNCDITSYEKIVMEQYVKYSGTEGVRKNLILKIPKECASSELSEEDFEDLIKIIAPYTTSQIKFIETNLGIKSCGYFNYLLSMAHKEGIDKQRAQRINTLLSNE